MHFDVFAILSYLFAKIKSNRYTSTPLLVAVERLSFMRRREKAPSQGERGMLTAVTWSFWQRSHGVRDGGVDYGKREKQVGRRSASGRAHDDERMSGNRQR